MNLSMTPHIGEPSPEVEMKPPWETFPTYERYTIGWRMGAGESYLYDWSDHVRSLPSDLQSRLHYLQQHRPAPLSWSDAVWSVLYPEREQREAPDALTIEDLLDLELVAHDAAYHTWLARPDEPRHPWEIFEGESPEATARYCTRELWFVSRWLTGHRHDLHASQVPSHWEPLTAQILTGEVGEVRPEHGLFTLAQMLCAGEVRPPWLVGLGVESHEDSFELDMGFCDAFQLWLMCAFDDRESLWRALPPADTIPAPWRSWLDAQVLSAL